MNVFLTEDLRDFVRKKVESGQFTSEEAVMQEALRRFREQGDGTEPEEQDWLDTDVIASCEREADETITLEQVRAATSKIKDSMARVVIEEERAERF
jgi:putative addiction module CopG family antidote